MWTSAGPAGAAMWLDVQSYQDQGKSVARMGRTRRGASPVEAGFVLVLVPLTCLQHREAGAVFIPCFQKGKPSHRAQTLHPSTQG